MSKDTTLNFDEENAIKTTYSDMVNAIRKDVGEALIELNKKYFQYVDEDGDRLSVSVIAETYVDAGVTLMGTLLPAHEEGTDPRKRIDAMMGWGANVMSKTVSRDTGCDVNVANSSAERVDASAGTIVRGIIQSGIDAGVLPPDTIDNFDAAEDAAGRGADADDNGVRH